MQIKSFFVNFELEIKIKKSKFEIKGTSKNPNSYRALPLGFCGIVTEIGLGGVFEIKLWVFRSSLNNIPSHFQKNGLVYKSILKIRISRTG